MFLLLYGSHICALSGGAQTWRLHTKLGKTLLRTTRELKTAETLFLAKLFIYLSSIISFIRDFIYRMVTIFRFDHMIGFRQHPVGEFVAAISQGLLTDLKGQHF